MSSVAQVCVEVDKLFTAGEEEEEEEEKEVDIEGNFDDILESDDVPFPSEFALTPGVFQNPTPAPAQPAPALLIDPRCRAPAEP